MIRSKIVAIATLSLGLFAIPAMAQTAAGGVVWRVGARVGQHDFTEAEQSIDAVFNGDSASMVGAQIEAQLQSGLFFGLSYETGSLDGHRVVLVPGGPPIQTNIEESLDVEPLRGTVGWMFRKDEALAPIVGAGITSLSWSEEGGGESVSGSGTGFHALAGLRYQWARFSIGGEVQYSSVPDTVGEAGVTEFFNEDDLGGTSIHVVALFHF